MTLDPSAIELPRYQCHKVVKAMKLREVMWGSNFLFPEDTTLPTVCVSHSYMEKHKPQPGGYYVVYEDGYQSFSPAEAFEAGYTRIEEPPT